MTFRAGDPEIVEIDEKRQPDQSANRDDEIALHGFTVDTVALHPHVPTASVSSILPAYRVVFPDWN